MVGATRGRGIKSSGGRSVTSCVCVYRFCPLTSPPLRSTRSCRIETWERGMPASRPVFASLAGTKEGPCDTPLPFVEVNQTPPLWWVKLHLSHYCWLLSSGFSSNFFQTQNEPRQRFNIGVSSLSLQGLPLNLHTLQIHIYKFGYL